MTIRRAFTLIELLISIGIGMALLAMGTSALLHVSAVFKRNVAQMQARDDASAIHQRLEESFSAMYHPAMMSCTASPGEVAPKPIVWNDGNEVLELTWMSTISDLEAESMDMAPLRFSDLVWNRLRYEGRGVDKDGKPLEGGTLHYGISSPTNTNSSTVVDTWVLNPTWNKYSGSVTTGPQPRRDRRRDMNDNDLRFLPGMTNSVYDSIALPGNSRDLDDRLRPLLPPLTQVAKFSLEWIDQDGYTTRCDASGISVTDPSGVSQASPGLPYAMYQNAGRQSLVIDGSWMDGRPWQPAPIAVEPAAPVTVRTAAGQRPLLIRIAFELIPASKPDPDAEEMLREAHLPFSFTFRAAPMLPKL